MSLLETLILACASSSLASRMMYSVHRLNNMQVSQEAGKVVWYSHCFKNFSFVVIHIVKSFSIINETEVDVFLEFPCFFYDPIDFGNLGMFKYN